MSPTRSIRSEWQVGWYVTRCGYEAPTSVTPSTSTSSSDSSYVLAATAAARSASASSPATRATAACWCRTDPTHDPDGATTTSYGSNVSTYRRTSGSASSG